MDPVPPEKRTWTTWNYVAYWISDATNAGIWQLASSMLAIGLSWRQALPAIAVAQCIIAVATPPFFKTELECRLDMILAGRHGLKRNHWCTIARCFPCTKSIVIRILVELFYRDKSSCPFNVLVRNSGESFSSLSEFYSSI